MVDNDGALRPSEEDSSKAPLTSTLPDGNDGQQSSDTDPTRPVSLNAEGAQTIHDGRVTISVKPPIPVC